MIKTTVLYDFGSEKTYLTKTFNNGDFDYKLAIKVINLKEYDDNFKVNYQVEILAVSPQGATEKNLKQAIDSMGMDEEDLKNLKDFEYEALITYGVYATLQVYNGNNLSELMKDARKELNVINMLFGFYMDKTCNALGSTGWDFITGEIWPTR